MQTGRIDGSMTGRERLTRIMNRQPTDRPAWTTLIDEPTRAGMADDLRSLHPFDFYRRIGCDILQLGDHAFWGKDEAVGMPFERLTPDVEVLEETQSDGSHVVRQKSRWGMLTTVYQGVYPVKHPVETVEDLRVLKAIWEHTQCREDRSHGFETRLRRIETRLGADGVYVHGIGASPVQQMLEYETGVEHFYYLLHDHAELLEETLAAIHAVRMQEYEILARRTTVECVIPMENTSTTMISPKVYEQFSLPQISDFVGVMHAHGRKAVLHMCGLLKNLLPLIRETGLDGINGLTPPPVGDTSVVDALDVLGEDLLILGAILDPSVFQKPTVSAAEIHAVLDGLYTPRVSGAHMLLWLGADGLPTPLERFLTVRDWMRDHAA
ncbi:MAG: uroporphyrinogen decarboxylase family protein [Kiritimatiellae bacterium]|nr:uroporphyrinogen decarboxylase family protein [Kiritimatiellia bacterium]